MIEYPSPNDRKGDEGLPSMDVLWQPLYHGVYANKPSVGFFMESGSNSHFVTNVKNIGGNGAHLAWPERFYCWEIELIFNREPNLDRLITFSLSNIPKFSAPLALFKTRDYRPFSFYIDLPDALRIEPQQHFGVVVQGNDIDPQLIYCVLNGYLRRHVQ